MMHVDPDGHFYRINSKSRVAEMYDGSYPYIEKTYQKLSFHFLINVIMKQKTVESLWITYGRTYVYRDVVYSSLLSLYMAFISDATGLTSPKFRALSEIDVLARVIYAEDTGDTDGQKAVALCIKKRMNYKGGTSEFINFTFGRNFKGACFKGFSTVAPSNDAKNPDNMYGMWVHAKKLAAKLMLGQAISPPSGYVGQLFFRSKNNFEKNVTNWNKTAGTGVFGGKDIKNIKQIGGNVFFDYAKGYN